MTLTVENIGPGPRNLPALSICHYGEQNGDAMRDPEMCFEMEIEDGEVKAIHPYSYRNDYAGIEQFAQDREPGLINARVEPRGWSLCHIPSSYRVQHPTFRGCTRRQLS